MEKDLTVEMIFFKAATPKMFYIRQNCKKLKEIATE